MSRMELNHWFVHDNKLSISLMRFYVGIEIINSYYGINYQLLVKDGNEMFLTFNFSSLEDAVVFTENTIAKSYNFKEIVNKYKEQLAKKTFKTSYDISKENNNKDIIYLLPQDVDEALIEYFEKDKDYRVSVKEELCFDNGNIVVNMYLINHLPGEKAKLLTENQIIKATNEYIGTDNYEVISFNYNIIFDSSKKEPSYNGIKLNINKKEKILSKNKKR